MSTESQKVKRIIQGCPQLLEEIPGDLGPSILIYKLKDGSIVIAQDDGNHGLKTILIEPDRVHSLAEEIKQKTGHFTKWIQ